MMRTTMSTPSIQNRPMMSMTTTLMKPLTLRPLTTTNTTTPIVPAAWTRTSGCCLPTR